MSTEIKPNASLTRKIFAVIVAGLAAAYLYGGVQLISAGGSPFYAISGAVWVVIAVLYWTHASIAQSVLVSFIVATLIWALIEVGVDPWGMLPRLSIPVTLGIFSLLLTFQKNSIDKHSRFACYSNIAALGVIAALAIVGFMRFGWESNPQTIETQIKTDPNHGNWLHYGNTPQGTRFSALDQITPDNVKSLKVAWSYDVYEDTPNGLQVTPLKVDDLVYLCNSSNLLVALDAETGEERWIFDPKVDLKAVPFRSCRGVAYYKAPEPVEECQERIFTNTVDARLIAVDAKSGKRCTRFGNNGEISLLDDLGDVIPGYYFYNSAPNIARDKVVLGGLVADNQYWGEPSGVIRAFNAITGQLAWAYDVGQPDRIGAPPEGEIYTPATPNSWAQMSYDDTLGLVYVPTGNATPDYFGGLRRPIDDEINSAILALDIETGRRRWVVRTLNHDVWDYDLASQPVLVDIPNGDDIIPALIQPTKRGELFIVNRKTGEAIGDIEQRPVPQSGSVPEEKLSPTQPFPTGLPSLAGGTLKESMMWGLTAFDQMWCRTKFLQARYEGTLTPPGLVPHIQYPGYLGGMNWGSATVDESTNILITVTNYMANYVRLVTREEADAAGAIPMGDKRPGIQAYLGINAQAGTPYAARTMLFMSPLNVPCQQPPWSRLTAIDLKSRQILWSQPLGKGDQAGPWGIKSYLPLTVGVPAIGGAITTQGGVTFVGATVDKRFRAFDTKSGKLLWESKLPQSANSTPSTYFSEKSKRQFIIGAAAGHRSLPMGSKGVNSVIAYALPSSPGS